MRLEPERGEAEGVVGCERQRGPAHKRIRDRIRRSNRGIHLLRTITLLLTVVSFFAASPANGQPDRIEAPSAYQEELDGNDLTSSFTDASDALDAEGERIEATGKAPGISKREACRVEEIVVRARRRALRSIRASACTSTGSSSREIAAPSWRSSTCSKSRCCATRWFQAPRGYGGEISYRFD